MWPNFFEKCEKFPERDNFGGLSLTSRISKLTFALENNPSSSETVAIKL